MTGQQKRALRIVLRDMRELRASLNRLLETNPVRRYPPGSVGRRLAENAIVAEERAMVILDRTAYCEPNEAAN